MHDDILGALNRHLDTVRAGTPVAWPNRIYPPIQGTPFLQISFLPFDTRVAELGRTGRNLHEGIYQISARYPPGEGHGEAMAKAAALMSGFRRGVAIDNNGVTVQIRRASQNPSIQEQNWFHVPISVYWFAFEEN